MFFFPLYNTELIYITSGYIPKDFDDTMYYCVGSLLYIDDNDDEITYLFTLDLFATVHENTYRVDVVKKSILLN